MPRGWRRTPSAVYVAAFATEEGERLADAEEASKDSVAFGPVNQIDAGVLNDCFAREAAA
jgi:hypothetical protein